MPDQIPPAAETDGCDNQVAERKPKKKCLVLSLIRHGQCQSNADQSSYDENDPLTELGKRQAERLGKDWKDVHIDGLFSSTLNRAYDTACQIRTHNHAPLEIQKSPLFVERKMGQEVIELALAGQSEAAGRLYAGLGRYQSGPTPRGYRPPRGGESLNDVAERAKISLVMLLGIYGVDLEEPPKEFVDKVNIDSPNVLPEGIPHVVVVSHNVFLSELYESMLGWNAYYRMTTLDYSNASWSRHILWYDTNTDRLEFSDMRVPYKIEFCGR